MKNNGRRHRRLFLLILCFALVSTFYYCQRVIGNGPTNQSLSFDEAVDRRQIVDLDDSYDSADEEDESDYDNDLSQVNDRLLDLATSTTSPKNVVEQGNVSYKQLLISSTKFNYTNNDVLVFLHIQKTGGTTFERYLVKQLQLPTPCKCLKGRKKCFCTRPHGSTGSRKSPWLFSRFSTGWSCGLHSDWTELVVSGCIDHYFDARDNSHRPRRYFITTFLREPLSRFVSEFLHVRRGATWHAAKHLCNGRPPTEDELPSCFNWPTSDWSGVSMEQFLDCPHNLAFNRQTRMLADLTTVHCYNLSAVPLEQRERQMLRSAKENLASMAFFGLQDEMRKSQYLFERTFNLTFSKPMLNVASRSSVQQFPEEQRARIGHANQLDTALYQYGRGIFFERFERAKRADPLFHLNMAT